MSGMSDRISGKKGYEEIPLFTRNINRFRDI